MLYFFADEEIPEQKLINMHKPESVDRGFLLMLQYFHMEELPMNKYDFMTQLDECLRGNVSETERMESVSYYKNYIDDEIRKGKTEQEVLSELGSPMGIAKSIIEARGRDHTENDVYEEYQESFRDNSASGKVFRVEGWKTWFVIAAVIFVVICVLSFVFKVFTILVPVLLPVFLVVFIVKLISGRR